ncbi:MAG: response regulator [bacterium]
MEAKKTKKIMIVEDEFVVAEDIKECLENMGYSVCCTVTSGEEALEKIEHEKPDLILMDIVLSGYMDGIETAEKIHGLEDIPIIFVTAHSDEEILDRAKITGPYGYILKPFDDMDLYINLEMAFYKANMDRSLRKSEEKFRNFIDSVDDIIVRIDNQTRFLYYNPAAERIFGLDPGKCTGLTLLDFIHVEDRKKTKDALIGSVRSEESFESRIIDHQGQIHDMLWKVNRCVDDKGNLTYINCIASDITARKKTVEELKEINKHLQESLIKIKSLSGNFSICGHCKRIRDDKGQWHPVEEYIRTHSDEDIIHTICLDCLKEIYPNIYHKNIEKKKERI